MSQRALFLRITHRYDEVSDNLLPELRDYLEDRDYEIEEIPEPPTAPRIDEIQVSVCRDRPIHNWILQHRGSAEIGGGPGLYVAICTDCGQVRTLGDGG